MFLFIYQFMLFSKALFCKSSSWLTTLYPCGRKTRVWIEIVYFMDSNRHNFRELRHTATCNKTTNAWLHFYVSTADRTAIEFRVCVENWTRRNCTDFNIRSVVQQPRFRTDSIPPVPFYIYAIHAGRTRYACGNHVERQVSRFRNCANSDRDHIMCRTCDPKDWRIEGPSPRVLSGSSFYCDLPPYCAHMRDMRM